MQTFIDTTTAMLWEFEDDVTDIFAFPETPPTLIPYAKPPITAQEQEDKLAIEAKILRDQLLTATDWVVTKATETGTAIPTNFITYRQALRDLPAQPGFPTTITWPILQ